MSISVVINTYNAEQYLAEVLESARNFDEIVVCDMESTDKTLSIAQSFGCKIVTFPKGTVSIVEPARNFAIASASSEWVLVIDADELITNELREYLYSRISKPDCPAGLFVPRKNNIMGMFVGSTYPDYQLRFFQKTKTDWPPIIHAKPHIDGRVEHIPACKKSLALIHKSKPMKKIFSHICIYTDNEVERRKGKRAGYAGLVFSPMFRFLKSFVIKGGFFYGKAGFIQAMNEAFYKYIVLCKLIEYKKNKKNKQQ